jgi:hypothetical protein
MLGLWESVRGGNSSRPVFITSPWGAAYLASLNVDGTPLFPGVSPVGGSIWGVPQLADAAADNHLILIDGGAVAVSDNGLAIERSDVASLQMTDTPSAGPTNLVSLFQSDSAAIKLTRFLYWSLGHADGVAFLDLPISGSPS